jgi:hypothetical protein
MYECFIFAIFFPRKLVKEIRDLVFFLIKKFAEKFHEGKNSESLSKYLNFFDIFSKKVL